MSESRKLPEHVTLPLLTLVTAQSLDGDYQHVANRKSAAGQPQSSPHALRNAAVIIALFGLMTVIAFVQTERNAEDSEAGRQRLISSITQQREALAARQSRIGALRQENRELSSDVARVDTAASSVTTAVQGIRAVSGFAAVTGPGVVVQLDDSADGSPDGRVRDQDLSVLLDGLWVAGAEAISVNGHRLTPLTGVRNVGVAVHIKAQPLKPPYVIRAIGNPNTLQSLFIESGPGVTFTALRNAYGFLFEMDNSRSLSLPASRSPRLRSAEVHISRLGNDMEVRP